MDNLLALAQNCILAPSGLDESHLTQAFSTLLNSSSDSGDIYFQLRKHETWSLEDGIVKDASYNINQGVGIRAIKGDKSGFAYSDEIVLPALTQAATAARSIAKHGKSGEQKILTKTNSPVLYSDEDPLNSIPTEDKVSFLNKTTEILVPPY